MVLISRPNYNNARCFWNTCMNLFLSPHSVFLTSVSPSASPSQFESLWNIVKPFVIGNNTNRTKCSSDYVPSRRKSSPTGQIMDSLATLANASITHANLHRLTNSQWSRCIVGLARAIFSGRTATGKAKGA